MLPGSLYTELVVVPSEVKLYVGQTDYLDVRGPGSDEPTIVSSDPSIVEVFGESQTLVGRGEGLVQRFYNQRRQKLQSPQIEPNPAHHALARLEKEWPGGLFLVTQNIDDLHEHKIFAYPLSMEDS